MKVVVFGGKGFLGTQVVKDLSKKGFKVYTFGGNFNDKNHFKGDITCFQDVEKATSKMDIVVNLVGLSPLRMPKKTTYHKVHVIGVKNIIKACKKNKRLVHISALGADKNSDIEYLKTKGIAEQEIKKSGLKFNVLRPSVMFDNGNEFIDSISRSSFLLFFPYIKAKMQPIYRKDVAKLVELAVSGKIQEKTIEIAGPEQISLYEIAKRIHKTKSLPIIPVPVFFLKPFLYFFAFFRLFGISKDQIKSLDLENITESNSAEKYIKLTSFDFWLKNNFSR